MANSRSCVSLLIAASAAVTILPFGSNQATSAECKRKTAGFYLQDINAGGPHSLALSLQSMPQSLTGALGDAERGRQLLVNRQKGDCLSCHKLGVMAAVADQGGIGPALDGIGSRFSRPQLRQVVVEPKAYFPDTIMPSYYKSEGSGDLAILTAAEVEDLVAFLETLK
ncbi:MAG: sulfur oxidation c-type cytochrome SoxX [Rhodomicrobium sp.]